MFWCNQTYTSTPTVLWNYTVTPQSCCPVRERGGGGRPPTQRGSGEPAHDAQAGREDGRSGLTISDAPTCYISRVLRSSGCVHTCPHTADIHVSDMFALSNAEERCQSSQGSVTVQRFVTLWLHLHPVSARRRVCVCTNASLCLTSDVHTEDWACLEHVSMLIEFHDKTSVSFWKS